MLHKQSVAFLDKEANNHRKLAPRAREIYLSAAKSDIKKCIALMAQTLEWAIDQGKIESQKTR
jgi:hypothetical protein